MQDWIRQVRQGIRKWRYPIWYYSMILLTLVCAAAGAYFRGRKVQTNLQVDRMVLGAIITASLALATWAFRTLLNEIRKISLGMRLLFHLETELHPDQGKLIMTYYQKMIDGRANGEFREL